MHWPCPPTAARHSRGPFNPPQVALNVSGPGMSHPPLGGEAFDAATANVTRWVVAEALKAATGPKPLLLFIPAAAQHRQHVLSMPVHCYRAQMWQRS